MSAFISRIKNWIGLENLTYSDLDAEFNNLIQKLGADTLSSANSTNGSAPTVTAMRATEDPGSVGSENLAMTLQDDVQQIRFMLNEIIGETYWYDTPLSNIHNLFEAVSNLSSPLPNRIISGRTTLDQPMFLIPNVSSNGISLNASPTPLDTAINGTETSFTSSLTLGSLSVAPSTGNTAVISDATLTGQQSSKIQGERNTTLQITSIGANISGRNGTYCAFKKGTELFIGELNINNVTSSVTFTDSSVTLVPTVVTYTTHPFNTNDQVIFSGGSLPTGVTAGTIYFVTVLDANTFQISLTIGGSFISTTSAGTGTAAVLKSNVIQNCFRGFFFNDTDAWIPRVTVTSGDSITLLQLTWVFLTNNASIPALDVTYSRPHVSYAQPTSPAIGDYWLSIADNHWKKYTGTVFANTDALLIGVCAQDTTNTIGARSFDFNNTFNELNNMEVEVLDSANLRTNKLSTEISVYSNPYQYNYDFVVWNTTNNLDTGVTLNTNTTYYAYISDLGEQFLSDIAPFQRKYDLLGDYHPAKPWRCVGQVDTDGSSNLTESSVLFFDYHERVLPYNFINNEVIPDNSIEASKLQNNSVGPTQLAPVNIQTAVMSTPSGFSVPGGDVDVPGLSLTITTTGRPVYVELGSRNGNISGFHIVYANTGNSQYTMQTTVFRDGNAICINHERGGNIFATGNILNIPIFQNTIDTGATAGTHTYKVQVSGTDSDVGNASISIQELQLVVYEL